MSSSLESCKALPMSCLHPCTCVCASLHAQTAVHPPPGIPRVLRTICPQNSYRFCIRVSHRQGKSLRFLQCSAGCSSTGVFPPKALRPTQQGLIYLVVCLFNFEMVSDCEKYYQNTTIKFYRFSSQIPCILTFYHSHFVIITIIHHILYMYSIYVYVWIYICIYVYSCIFIYI